PAHISNWNNNVSEIILCNADHSVIDNVTIDNSADRNGIWIIGTDYSNFTNLHLMDMRYGLYLWYYSDNNIIKDSTITSSAGWGMRIFYRCNNNLISNVTFKSGYMGLRMYRSNNNTITNCKFEGNSNKAVYMYYAGDTAPNKFYNNLFNNTNNLYFAGTVYHNVWNQNKMFSKSKVGGPYMGGNYWGKPDGTGFSDTCTDADGDGICDSSYQLNSNGPNIDYYPLSLKYDKAAPTTWTVGEDDYGDVYSFNTEVRSKYVKVSLFCSDDKSGCKEIKYCVDRDNTCIPSITYENPIEITTNGKSYVRFRGIDRYSNTEEINSVVVILNTTIEKVTVEMDFDINGISGDTGMVGEEGMGVYSKSQLSKYYTCSYDSVEGGQPAAAMIFTGSKFDSASLSQDTENKMKISQYYEGNHLIIALVNGSCSAISNSYGSIGSIAYTPLSSIEFKHKYPVLVKLKYPSVDIVGNLTLGEGTHTLVFEKEKSEKRVKILVKEK
ncbi:MAG: right-handed parallel beta-helix repeat-containing protein, partial [Candidatus Aenigmarchaeota archaeon]|nr:right-handed parallel beta-helix repeat-containing protein [Candidatus Aenigmarchaeota archaeon]